MKDPREVFVEVIMEYARGFHNPIREGETLEGWASRCYTQTAPGFGSQQARHRAFWHMMGEICVQATRGLDDLNRERKRAMHARDYGLAANTSSTDAGPRMTAEKMGRAVEWLRAAQTDEFWKEMAKPFISSMDPTQPRPPWLGVPPPTVAQVKPQPREEFDAAKQKAGWKGSDALPFDSDYD